MTRQKLLSVLNVINGDTRSDKHIERSNFDSSIEELPSQIRMQKFRIFPRMFKIELYGLISYFKFLVANENNSRYFVYYFLYYISINMTSSITVISFIYTNYVMVG